MPNLPRFLRMVRDTDVSGVSGTGTVAEVAVFSDGQAAVHWLSEYPTTTPHESMTSVEHIHSHNGATRFVPYEQDEELEKLRAEIRVLRDHLSSWEALVSDLDRCVHGRHQIDPCAFCPHSNTGNPHLREGDVIGYTVYGRPITVPARSDMSDPRKWRPGRRG